MSDIEPLTAPLFAESRTAEEAKRFPPLTDAERDQLIASIKAADAEIDAGHFVEYAPGELLARLRKARAALKSA